MIAKAINTSFEKIRVFQRKLYRAAKAAPERKFGVLYDKVYRKDVLWYAWSMVKANAGAPGVDRQTIREIEEAGIDVLLNDLQKKLEAKRYKPKPVRRVYIPKANGKQRPLGIPTVVDRIVQAAVKIVIEPIFEADFKDFSYGFRPKRNAHMALREIYKYLNFGCQWVVDADLKAYFDTIPQDKLMITLRQRITDKAILKLIELWLKAGVMEGMEVRKQLTGTPQGGVISPLLANIYLHWLDKIWVKRGYNARNHNAHMVRYADDFVILCRKNPEFYLQQAKGVLNKLDLTLNEDKTRIVNATEGFDFLGHHFVVEPSKLTGKLKSYYYPSGKAQKVIRAKIKEIVRHGQHKDLPELINKEINPVLRGWGNYFKTGNARKIFLKIDNYVTYVLTIMLRKKHKKRSKGWREHPPSWYYGYQQLFSLNKLLVGIDGNTRYERN